MYSAGMYVQIIDHSEPQCNNQYGYITHVHVAYHGNTHFYIVELERSKQYCVCNPDELMEG